MAMFYLCQFQFVEKQQEKEALFNQKQDCLRVVLDFIKNLKNVAGVDDIVKTIEKLTASEQKDRIRTQNQYLDEIASMTEVSIATLKRIKKEGVVNEGVWNTPGKKRPHKPTVSNLDSFDKDVIRNKIKEYYIVRKQVPTLRTLLVELKESIGFTGCRETLRHLLLSNGYAIKRNKNENHIIHIENKYKERDRIIEDNLERFIINVGDSDSSGSNESFHMEMLDSDFDYDSE